MKMNIEDKKVLLSKLQSRGILIKEVDVNSFRELYKKEIEHKIATSIKAKYDKELMEAAPKLRQIAEMYHDYMLGSDMEKTMVFDIVKNVLYGPK